MAHPRLSIVIIGAGPVGRGLALLFRKHGHKIVGIGSRRLFSAKELAKKVGGAAFRVEVSNMQRPLLPVSSRVDLIVLSVPDGQLSTLAGAMSTPGVLPSSTRIVHTSGPLTSEILAPLSRRGHKTCSMHPVQSFPPTTSAKEMRDAMQGIWFGLEGSKSNVRWLSRFVSSLGCHPFLVPKESKILYHLACTFASNYIVALVGVIDELARTQRIPPRLGPFGPLIRFSLRNAFVQGPRLALTGPVMRGGVEVLRKHAASIRRHAPHLQKLFQALVGETARQGVAGKRITSATASAVKRAVGRNARGRQN